ncbi:MAG: thiopurine S-methyltransferase [SAR324 cluster bacterium]|nr:thiopurine S-methyltransferase [SAR324 cluster bacterium]MBL7035387.1 thiopurine S-methyltransferase [SAR324 cluster bacterium]
MNQWEARWQEGRIGFHLPAVNTYLLRYSAELLQQDTERVFVPLCGKTLDLNWLAARTQKVVGVELVEKAVADFYQENELSYTIQQSGNLRLFCNTEIDLYQGDFFELFSEQTDTFKAIYDRGSIVAIEQSERQKYVEHLMSFLEPGGRLLLVSLEYKQEQMSGPPYSVSREEIEMLCSPFGSLQLLESCDILDERLLKKGLDGILECVFLLQKH